MTASESPVFDLVIVSAFGRGNWIASELAGRGWKVVLADITEQLGKAQSEDIEGPFGLLESQDLLPSQRARLADEGELETLEPGFTLWLPQGPLEFRSELTPFLLRARRIPEAVEGYIRRAGTKPHVSERERKTVARMAYDRCWLAHLAHALSSATHKENHIAAESGVASPLFSAFAIRQLSDAGVAKGLKACQSAGVTMRLKSRVRDVRLSGKLIDAVEFSDERAGAERSRAILWAVSPTETKQISEALSSLMFPMGVPAPQWSWERFRFKIQADHFLNSFPYWCAMIADRDLAWTRANLVILRRKRGEAVVDAWAKMPVWMRTDRNAAETVRREIEMLLRARLPGAEITPVLAEFAPLLWPVYEASQLKTFKTAGATNLFFSAPEFWKSLDWLGRFRYEGEVLTRLDRLKAIWDAAAAKAAAQAAKKNRSELSP